MRILLGGIPTSDTDVLQALPDERAAIHAVTTDELIEGIYACSPDIVIVSAELPEVWEALKQISTLLPVPVVVIASNDMSCEACPLEMTDIFACLVRPLTASNVRQAIAVACTQFQRLHGARAEAAQLREAFASRKLIDRAKGLVMQRQRISEGEAYAFLREESRRQRIPIVEIARTLLEQSNGTSATNKLPQMTAITAPPRRVTAPLPRSMRDSA